MKIRRDKFIIIKTEDGRYNIALRKYPDHPLDISGFDTKKEARERLNKYIHNVNENNTED